MKNIIQLKFKTEILPLSMILISFVSAFYFYAKFPETVATHWNFEGVADGFSTKSFAAFFFPVMIFGIYLLFNFLPIIDPRRERYEQFASTYRIFRNIIIFFMVFIYFITGFANIGYDLNIGLWVSSSVGLLFVILGNYMGKLKKNWFVGIRTPWTLSSENVWNKTHRFSGKLFMLTGVLISLSSYVPSAFRLWIFIPAIAIMVVGSFVYSYIVYAQENKKK